MGALEFILLFVLGVVIGGVLDFIFLKRAKKLKLENETLKSEKEALTSEIEKLNGDIKHLKERLGFLYIILLEIQENLV